ncbi:penicillin-binding transpeptidase domain-containing protein [Corynebacterium sp. YIM 101645]|uniref:Penicillin-binding transpeptidase domain-containing protein n=1 Tax=Corynebacterium lemuris TaxID=1859292 RepID=A0ABT2G119_9CORY|nr:penicillin-binding transpeptidase domain-containing protein [Corynebacterium lemuris]MCS5479977.1 penicillin-binding transpeptidase domain-containing protein [Corynebacterium lemuris]
MNRSIRFASVFALLLTLVLLVNLTIIHTFREEEYASNPLNQRGFYELKSTPRGQISAGGMVLASSAADEEGLYQRSYPSENPAAFGSVTGFLSDRYGASGLESSYNGVLNGTDSSLFASRWMDVLTGRDTAGANLELTIDPRMQEVAHQQLTANNYEGAVVAMRPSSGAVLALASSPGFDPNPLVNPSTADATWEALNSDPGNPLINHASQETLPPGSIFKIITTAAGLNNGYSAGSSLTGAPSITLPGTNTSLTNYAGQACAGGGSVTLETAFELSCNTAFVEMAIDVGTDEMRSAAEAFGIGEDYDLGLPTSPGSLGDIPDAAALGQTSIGQRDVTMSALQAAVMAATVANDGRRMEPYVVDRITGSDLEELRSSEPNEITQAISPEVADQLEQLMLASERNTSGGRAGIASKTGTAEHGADGTPPHTWYVAYLPDQDVAVAVVVKDGGGYGRGATGGQVASPVGRAVLDAAGGA